VKDEKKEEEEEETLSPCFSAGGHENKPPKMEVFPAWVKNNRSGPCLETASFT